MKLNCNGKTLDLGSPRVMGILNVTPDSFSDGGRFLQRDAAVVQALQMEKDGAAIVDVGGESTRPGASPVSLQEELDRVIPVIEILGEKLEIPVSVDTSKPEVMREAIQAGAGLINDVNALRSEGALVQAAALGVPVCLMHMQGRPDTMQQAPRYDSVLDEVRAFLTERIGACVEQGIPHGDILVDPGFGFGKTLMHNLELLHGLGELEKLGCPLLVGLSRKSMLGTLTGREPEQRVAASVAAALLAVERGASIVRVHDVAETVDVLKVLEAVIDPASAGR
ncbi:MAG TPA: dihydropteroate synthase [Thiolapillus brandeum]|uniref:Dihydropteroate synthase n=1 Tax=Thiolapillus brandeum TaxID=1076588 RepID=A0A831WAP9_9GAMM|nr:dihydropteroate synthase [Thiolapillus brandeum]